MGENSVVAIQDAEARKRFLKHLLDDVDALDYMLENGMIESGISRIGFEQEFCLVDKHFRPSEKAIEVLTRIEDPHFTSELARYNLEINMDPCELVGGCFSKVEDDLRAFLNKASDVAEECGDKVILTGILPSIGKREIGDDFMTPRQRYYHLGKVLRDMRGQDFELNIIGVDDLIMSHSNILLEACNTSFQIHLQIEADEFVDMYNWAQMITGPVLALCTNSPMLFGRQLWSETRIALFQQSIDIRSKGRHLRERRQRVSFGNDWLKNVTDIYKNDISRYEPLVIREIENNSLEMLKRGEIPKLEALNLHNGTIWKWNRPCYGVGGGLPHLRIENRYIPSGPTVTDEIANSALWIGLMKAMPEELKGNWESRQFVAAKENFYRAATVGIQAGLNWKDELVSAADLALSQLIPMARKGLESMNVRKDDIDKYMGVIERRAMTRQTGSRWLNKSYRQLRKRFTRDEATVALTYLLHKRRLDLKPIHEWDFPAEEELEKLSIHYDWVSAVMTTDLITVQETDLIELVDKIMDWGHVRHVPVEDAQGRLKGLLTKNQVEQFLASGDNTGMVAVGEIMKTDLVTVSPDTDIRHAMLKMIDKGISCVPVVDGEELIGLLTDHDMKEIWGKIESNEG